MRSAGLIIAALIAGFLLGGVQPRRALADLEDQLEDMQIQLEKIRRKADRADRARSFSIPDLSQLYTLAADRADGDDGDDRAGGGRRSEEDPAEDEAEDTAAAAPPTTAAPPPPEQLDAAVEAQRLRAAQSRAALIEQLDLNNDEIAELDAVVDQMNDSLAGISDEVVDIAFASASGGDEPAPVELMAMTHDVTGILLDAQEGLDDLAGDDVGTLDESTGAVWNYVDLGSFRDASLELGGQLGE